MIQRKLYLPSGRRTELLAELRRLTEGQGWNIVEGKSGIPISGRYRPGEFWLEEVTIEHAGSEVDVFLMAVCLDVDPAIRDHP